MRLKPFLLDDWLDQYEHDIEFDLGASTGPRWTVNDVLALADDETRRRFLNHDLVNSPHHPTGATIGDSEMEALHEFAAARGIQLVCDEVYHPIYHGRPAKSAARLPHATMIGDLSKAFSIPGVRTGWIVERDAQR